MKYKIQVNNDRDVTVLIINPNTGKHQGYMCADIADAQRIITEDLAKQPTTIYEGDGTDVYHNTYIKEG